MDFRAIKRVACTTREQSAAKKNQILRSDLEKFWSG